MVISEKQVMQLIMMARCLIEELKDKDAMANMRAYQLGMIVEEIIDQQSEELKEII
jgi:hypothetical protein